MIAYIIKSGLSLLVLFGIYFLILRKEKLFTFNRFYLIFSVYLSLVIPFISIPVDLAATQAPVNIITTVNDYIPIRPVEEPQIYEMPVREPSAPQPERLSFSQILWILYIFGTGIFLFRFIRSIYKIFHQKHLSEQSTFAGRKLILVDDHINPYCFFNMIFVGKQDYLNKVIDSNLLNHELSHIRQAHSADVVFIELISIFYWFNPILILYNNAIRINHEFLADDSTIKVTNDLKSYSDKLLGFIDYRLNMSLTSAFNKSLTRKRIIMMTKNSKGRISNSIMIISTLLTLTIFAIIISCKQAGNGTISMQFVPQGQYVRPVVIRGEDTLKDVTVSLNAFLMSNEISNRQYREFTDWAVKNQDQVLYQTEYRSFALHDKKTGITKDTLFNFSIPVKISEILDKMIDSTALFKLDEKYKNYFTDNKYDDYPVVGVSKIMAGYFCTWKTIMEKSDSSAQHSYRLPMEEEWEYAAQYSGDENEDKSNESLHKVNEGKKNSLDLSNLNCNVSEYVSSKKFVRGAYYSSGSELNSSDQIVKGSSWKSKQNIYERRLLGIYSGDGTIGFRIVKSYMPDVSKNKDTQDKLNSKPYIKDKSLYDEKFIDRLSLLGDYTASKVIDNYIITQSGNIRYFPESLPLKKTVILKAAEDNKNYILSVKRTSLTNLLYSFDLKDINGKIIDSRSGEAILNPYFILAAEFPSDSRTGEGYPCADYQDKSNGCLLSIEIAYEKNDQGELRALITYWCEDRSLLQLAKCPTLRTERFTDKPGAFPIRKDDYSEISGTFGEVRINPVTKEKAVHNGIDFKASSGTNIMAINDGTVIQAASLKDGYGNTVMIVHPDGYQSRYSHLKDFIVKNGVTVSKGQVIGHVGNTGISTSPHLHLEILFKGKNVNPMDYLQGN